MGLAFLKVADFNRMALARSQSHANFACFVCHYTASRHLFVCTLREQIFEKIDVDITFKIDFKRK